MTTLTLDATNTARARQARTDNAPMWLTLDPCLHCKPRPPFDERPTCVCGLVDLLALTEPCKTCGGTGHRHRTDRFKQRYLIDCPDCPKLLTLQGECCGSVRHCRDFSRPGCCWGEDGTGTVDLGEWRVEQVVPIVAAYSEPDGGQDRARVYDDETVTLLSGRIWKSWDLTDIDLGPDPQQHIGRYAYKVEPT